MVGYFIDSSSVSGVATGVSMNDASDEESSGEGACSSLESGEVLPASNQLNINLLTCQRICVHPTSIACYCVMLHYLPQCHHLLSADTLIYCLLISAWSHINSQLSSSSSLVAPRVQEASGVGTPPPFAHFHPTTVYDHRPGVPTEPRRPPEGM